MADGGYTGRGYEPDGIVHLGDFPYAGLLFDFYTKKEAALSISVADFREVYPELFQPEETDAEAATRIKKAAEFSRGYDAYQSSRANVYPVGINIPDDLSGEGTEETD